MNEYDVVLIGAGIMSATLAAQLHQADPSLRLAVIERLSKPGMESSGPWHNAGTGHAGLCELNYTPVSEDGSVDVAKALEVNAQFQESLAFWRKLIEQGHLDPRFLSPRPHMSFVRGPDVAFLRSRYAALRPHPGFTEMQYSEDPATIASWAPLLMADRTDEPVAATYHPGGYDVDFGDLTAQLLSFSAADLYFDSSVTRLRQCGKWEVRFRQNGEESGLTARKVFVGAGGGTLPLFQKAKVREVRGYGGFPISGRFWATAVPGAVDAHRVKVYGKAGEGAPPMSVPHLDARRIEGQDYILFGPFAGWSPRFLKAGHLYDLFASVRWHNVLPQVSVALRNPGLLKYLISEVFAGDRKKLNEVRAFYPRAERAEWHEVVAGQRVQVIKPVSQWRGELQFGTEVITSADGSIAGLLGASPGASTAVSIMKNIAGTFIGDEASSV